MTAEARPETVHSAALAPLPPHAAHAHAHAPAAAAQVAAAIEAAAEAPAAAEASSDGAAEAHCGAAVLVRPPGHVSQPPAHAPPPPLPAGGPVALLAPRGGAAAAHAAAAAASAAAAMRRGGGSSSIGEPGASSHGRATSAASFSPPPGPEANLFAWVASLLVPIEGPSSDTASPGHTAPGSDPYGAHVGGYGAGGAGPEEQGSGGGGRGDSDLWSWQRGRGAAQDAADEEAAMAAGSRLWDATAVRNLRGKSRQSVCARVVNARACVICRVWTRLRGI
jgi:hypothetical protein